MYDLERALTEPGVLDGDGLLPWRSWADAEIYAACWLAGDRLAVATGEDEGEEDEDDPATLGHRQLGVRSLSEQRHVPTSVAALHPDGSRLAVAQPDGIAIVTLPPPVGR
ncbi:hypothetical protein KV205_01045 [Streptomyces sp. SKN60]|uniref:hypothetical protein n=1 Tax=Streptomyces sp. SKN60 TaxID=2855506 RepID=UPI002247D897|nr:hypothetical protein [Streptomyces sp. SKN60]MCX2179120.1 hypothetical protein [Streptomyces sp. SKN60]